MNVQSAAEQVQKVQHAIDNACAQIRAGKELQAELEDLSASSLLGTAIDTKRLKCLQEVAETGTAASAALAGLERHLEAALQEYRVAKEEFYRNKVADLRKQAEAFNPEIQELTIQLNKLVNQQASINELASQQAHQGALHSKGAYNSRRQAFLNEALQTKVE